MTNRLNMDHQAVFEVACIVKPIYDVHQQRLMDLVKDPSNQEKTLAWYESIEAYHRILMKKAATLGIATKVGRAGIVSLMGVRGATIMWTPDMLRQIANYERINPNYWVHPEAVKLHNYTFPPEIA